jgi:hypothetical protein
VTGRSVRDPELFARLARGRGGRAAWLMVVAVLVPTALVLVLHLAIWRIGWSESFTETRWVPGGLAFLVLTVGIAVTWYRTTTWIVVAAGEDELVEVAEHLRLSDGAAAAVFLLRRVLLGAALVLLFFTSVVVWVDLRWWVVVGSPEVDALPDRAARMPVPDDWVLQETSVDERVAGGPPRGGVTQTFELPAGASFADLEELFASSAWARSFGALQDVECDAELGTCDAEAVPPPGEEVTSYLDARIDELDPGGPPQVEIELTYRDPAAPLDPVYFSTAPAPAATPTLLPAGVGAPG